MQCYWRIARLLAIYIEFSKGLGPAPFFKKQCMEKELIVEFPYGYVIITPRCRLQTERAKNITSQKYGNTTDEKRNKKLSGTLARITNN